MKKEFQILALIPVASFLAILLPVWIINGIGFNGEILDSYDPMTGLIALFLLLAIGFVSGFLGQRFMVLKGLLIISPLPMIAVYEMCIDPTSHNLWPLEFIFYGIYGLFASIGPIIGSNIARLLEKQKI
jgi:hypothetical protein